MWNEAVQLWLLMESEWSLDGFLLQNHVCFRHQVPEENHQCCNQCNLAIRLSVGRVPHPGLGQLWAGALRNCLLSGLDGLWGVAE